MTCGIYIIRNSVNGKVYVGSSTSINRRWGFHRSQLRRGVHHSKHLQRSWNIDGEDAFEFLVIAECEECDLGRVEQENLDVYKAFNPAYGYNSAPVAQSNRGIKRSEETRRKISEITKGRKHSDESRRKMSESRMGKRLSQEGREKLSKAKTGVPRSAETREKIKAGQRARRQRELEAKLAAQVPKHSTDSPVIAS